MVRIVLLLSFLCSFFAVTLVAAELPVFDRNQPIEVTAQQLEMLQLQRQSVFTGDVVARQGEMTLYAQKLIIFLQPDEDQVERMEATGGVRILQLDRVATAEQVVFYQLDEMLILRGNAEVVQGANKISGEEIRLYLRENRSVVKSSESGRVRATIVPEQLQE